jgi:hypothetical protein
MAKGHACGGSSSPIIADGDCESWRREAGSPPPSAFAPSAWAEEIVAAAVAWIWSARSLKPPPPTPPSAEMPLPSGGKTMSTGAGVDISSDLSIPLALLVAPSAPSSADDPCPPDICEEKSSVWCVRRGWAVDKRPPPTNLGWISVQVDGEGIWARRKKAASPPGHGPRHLGAGRESPGHTAAPTSFRQSFLLLSLSRTVVGRDAPQTCNFTTQAGMLRNLRLFRPGGWPAPQSS